VRDGDDLNGGGEVAVDQGERETAKKKSARAVGTSGPTMRRFEDLLDGAVDFFPELLGSASASLAIPAHSLFRFLNGCGMDGESRPWGHSLADFSLRRNSSSETVFALPESRSAMRRAISSFQAASTTAGSSRGSSRLSSRESTSWARSSGESVSAFLRSSVASCVMTSVYRFQVVASVPALSNPRKTHGGNMGRSVAEPSVMSKWLAGFRRTVQEKTHSDSLDTISP
jgi:hypothetical protein